MLRRLALPRHLSNQTSSGANRQPLLRRPISIKNTYHASSSHGQVMSVLLRVGNDIRPNESSSDYHARSTKELTEAFRHHVEFQDSPFLLLNVRQSVIDPSKWNANRTLEVINQGHIWAGVFNITNGRLVPEKKTLVNKVYHGFLSEDEAVSNMFTNSSAHEKDIATLSSEFYLAVLLECCRKSIGEIQAALESAKKTNLPYDIRISACSQAVYQVITGKDPLHAGLAPASTQRCAITAVMDILAVDLELHKQIQKMFHESRLAIRGDQLGAEYVAQKHNSSFSPK